MAIADRALYLVKPDRGLLDNGLADPYLRALDDTALALLDRTDQDGLLATILARASALLGTPHAWIDLLEPDAAAFVMRVGTGVFAEMQGSLLGAGDGVAGAIVRTGQPIVVDDYDAWPGRPGGPPAGLGATVGAPLKSAGVVDRCARGRRRAGHAPVHRAGRRGADELRPARLDRARECASRRRREARGPVRHHHGSAEPRAADRPDRPRPRGSPARRRRFASRSSSSTSTGSR